MRHLLSTVIYIFKSQGLSRLDLVCGYLKIIYRAYAYHKVLKYFRQKPPEFFSIKVAGLKIDFYNYVELVQLFEEIFIREAYKFKTEKSHPVIVDCGSNIGLSVLYFKKTYPNSTVLAFEPDEKNARLLKTNIGNNQLQGVIMHKIALTNEKSERPFFITSSEIGSLNNSLLASPIHATSVMVQTERLSEFINGHVDWLKIDTEGSEGNIIMDLCSSKKIKNIHQLLIEYHKQCNISLSDLEKLLAENNFIRSNSNITPRKGMHYLEFRRP